MIQVIALINFQDLEKGVARNAGDSFLCFDERAKYLESLKFVKIQQLIKEETKNKVKKTVHKRKR